MKKLFVLSTILIFTLTTNISASADWETDFDAFMVGDPKYKVATFKFLGEETTKSVTELKQQLKDLGYGNFFAGDDPGDGYTHGVNTAFREYVRVYEEKLKKAVRETN